MVPRTAQPPYSYSWSPATGLSNPNVVNPACSVTTTTTYTLTVTDANGCTDTDQMNVTVTPSSVATLISSVALVNFNGVPTFYQCGSTPTVPFNFTDPGGTTAGSTYQISWGNATPNYSANTAPNTTVHIYGQGIYTLTYTITDANNCVSTATYQVFFGSNPAVGLGNPGNTNVCAPDLAHLSHHRHDQQRGRNHLHGELQRR
ncbi:MAG: hypothetical protein IPP26_01535 [Flavobacteriales bacterium]|nr:hypothetical protein [Flavobacteriales bacterium]